ncbi:ATP-binding protein [Microbacterium elymi]|uniref:ATP-binding protein n=1 Tax=Microbacterium elymi TaxID=2909587 RepID=UPI0033904F7F
MESLADTRPLVLMIEDLHWADGGTLTLLSFLLRVVTRGRLLVVLAWRKRRKRPQRSGPARARRSRAGPSDRTHHPRAAGCGIRPRAGLGAGHDRRRRHPARPRPACRGHPVLRRRAVAMRDRDAARHPARPPARPLRAAE